MSDYLTRLIERSMGVAPQIEPLIAPFHSPPEQVLTEPGEMVAASFREDAPEKGDTPPPDIAPDDGGETEFEQASFPRTESRPPSAAVGLPKAPAQLAAESDPAGAQPRVPEPQTSFPSTPETALPVSSSVLPSAISPRSTRPAPRPDIAERSRPVPASRHSLEWPPGKGPPVVKPQIIGPRLAAAFRSEPKEELLANQPAPIQVTIGRVEVRAVMAPAVPPKVAAPAAPKISLEEYLKQRNGGRS